MENQNRTVPPDGSQGSAGPGFGQGRLWPLLLTLVTAAIAVFLRMYLLRQQVIGDDEWNAIMSASNSSYLQILTHFQHADNCIPLSVFYKLVMEFRDLDELAVRAIQVLAGISMILVFPRIAARMFGKDTSLVFGLLLALSPFLTYYSRFARPYIVQALVGFLGIVWFYEWIQTRKRTKSLLYVAAAVTASYFSPVAAPSLLAPLIYGFACVFLKSTTRFRNVELPSLRWKEMALVAAGTLGGILAWFLPAAGSLGVLANKTGREAMTFSTVLRTLEVFSGYQNLAAALAVLAIAVLGAGWLYRHNRTFLSLFLSALAVQVAALMVVRPLGIQDELVFSRYLMVGLPFFLLLVSIGCVKVLAPRCAMIGNTQHRVVLLYLALVAASLAFSPLTRAYAANNSFTNHSDYQRPDFSGWTHAASAPPLVSRFYLDLGADQSDQPVIEFPYFIWWPGNVAHYYQQVHRHRVKIGCWPPRYFLPRIPLHDVQFENFVPLDSDAAIADSGARYAVVHKDMAREVLHVQGIWSNGAVPGKAGLDAEENIWEGHYGPAARMSAQETVAALGQRFGAPWFEDQWITVFKLR